MKLDLSVTPYVSSLSCSNVRIRRNAFGLWERQNRLQARWKRAHECTPPPLLNGARKLWRVCIHSFLRSPSTRQRHPTRWAPRQSYKARCVFGVSTDGDLNGDAVLEWFKTDGAWFIWNVANECSYHAHLLIGAAGELLPVP